jgi:hypothetical protein
MASQPTEPGELKRLKAENARLRAENKRLDKMVGQRIKKSHPRSPWMIFQNIGVIVLVAFAVALLAAGNILFWFGNTIVKQERFVAATEPIIKDPKVQQTMSLYVTNSIFNNIDVQKITEEALPPKADFLAPQLTSQLKSGTQNTLKKILAKPSFQDKWNAVLAKQHDRLISFTAKYNGDGTISLNDVYNQLDDNLKSTKLSFLADKKLPSKIGNVTVVNATWLPAFHNVVTNIDTWRLLAVIALVISLAAAVWLSKNRRRTVYVFAAFASLLMLITLIVLRFMREIIAGKADSQYAGGVRSAVQIFFHPLVLQTTTIFFAVLLVGIIAWISGTSKSAALVQNQIALLFSGRMHDSLFGEGAPANGFMRWVQSNKRLMQWLVVALFAAIMLLVRLTLKALTVYTLLILLSVLAIEVVGGKPNTHKSTSS